MDNYDNFRQTIMDLEASQIEDPVRQGQVPQAANHYGATTEETCSQCFTPLPVRGRSVKGVLQMILLT